MPMTQVDFRNLGKSRLDGDNRTLSEDSTSRVHHHHTSPPPKNRKQNIRQSMLPNNDFETGLRYKHNHRPLNECPALEPVTCSTIIRAPKPRIEV